MTPAYTLLHMTTPDWDAVPSAQLVHMPWLPPCAVAARAQACCDGEHIHVRMEAEEEHIRAAHTGLLDAICEDSCMEFFFAPMKDDARYFNFEWNPRGALYLGFGAERNTRVRQIVRDPQALFAPETFTTARGWGITFRVPASFIRLYMPEFQMSGEAAANFYKCGDCTQTPHYLAWAPLTSDTPDYHRRQDFGRIVWGGMENL